MLYIEYNPETMEPVSPYLDYDNLRTKFDKEGMVLPLEEKLTDAVLSSFNYGAVDLHYREGDLNLLKDIPYGKVVILAPPIFEDEYWKRTLEYIDASDADVDSIHKAMTQLRDYLLQHYMDRISPPRWEDFTEEERIEIRQFRRDLLDLPDQENYPWVDLPNVPLSLTDGEDIRVKEFRESIPWKQIRVIGPIGDKPDMFGLI